MSPFPWSVRRAVSKALAWSITVVVVGAGVLVIAAAGRAALSYLLRGHL